MYRFAPTNPVRFRYTLPSALCCLAGVLIFSGLFSFYIDNFYRVSVLYGSLAAFIFLMMWIHLLARMLLLGFVFDHSAEMDTES
jgi:membrane protein